MKRRRVILGVLASLGLAAAAVAVTLWATEPAPGVTEENARRLRAGMSMERVEAILGKPHSRRTLEAGGTVGYYQTDLKLRATFNRDDCLESVIRIRHEDAEYVPLTSTFLDRVRDFLGL